MHNLNSNKTENVTLNMLTDSIIAAAATRANADAAAAVSAIFDKLDADLATAVQSHVRHEIDNSLTNAIVDVQRVVTELLAAAILKREVRRISDVLAEKTII